MTAKNEGTAMEERQPIEGDPGEVEADDRSPMERFYDELEEEGTDWIVWVYRRDGSDWGKVCEVSGHEFDADAIAAKYGAGKYKLRLRDNETKEWGAQCTVPLRAPEPSPAPQPLPSALPIPVVPPPVVASPSPDGGMMTVMLTMLQAQMQQTTAMMQAVVSQASGRTSAPTSEIIEAIKLGQAMAQKPSDDDGEDDDGFGKLASMLTRFLPVQHPAAPSSPAPAANDGFAHIEHAIRAAVASPPMPEVWADVLIGQVGAETARKFVGEAGSLVALVLESCEDLQSHRAKLDAIEAAMRKKLVPALSEKPA